jgi:hypothetical protein
MDVSVDDDVCDREGSDPALFATPKQHRTKGAAREYRKEETEYDGHGLATLCSSPSSSRVMSPLSSESSWSPEPRSPVEWSDNGETRRDPPFLPSLFSPWMCVFDLDAACGTANSVLDDRDAQPYHRPKSPSASLPKDWNHLLPPLDLSQWFGGAETTTIREDATSDRSSPPPRDVDSITAPPKSTAVPHGSGLAPFRPVPVYPSPNVTRNHYFTNFASDHSIEAIFVPPFLVCVSSYHAIAVFAVFFLKRVLLSRGISVECI